MNLTSCFATTMFTPMVVFPALSSHGQRRSETVINVVILRWNLSKDNDVVILDEATASVDADNERAI